MKRTEILEGLARKAANAAEDCRTLLEVLVQLPGSSSQALFEIQLTGEILPAGSDIYVKISERWKMANGYRELPGLVKALEIGDDEDQPSVAQEKLS